MQTCIHKLTDIYLYTYNLIDIYRQTNAEIGKKTKTHISTLKQNLLSPTYKHTEARSIKKQKYLTFTLAHEYIHKLTKTHTKHTHTHKNTITIAHTPIDKH